MKYRETELFEKIYKILSSEYSMRHAGEATEKIIEAILAPTERGLAEYGSEIYMLCEHCHTYHAKGAACPYITDSSVRVK